MTMPSLSRRQTLAALASGVAACALPGCAALEDAAMAGTTALTTTPEAQLDALGYALLRHEPTRATGLGVDVGEFATLRSQLADSSQAGRDAYASTLRQGLGIAEAWLARGGMDADNRTSFEVVASAYRTAIAGFALPYGDIPVGSWRTAPYTVIQNVGAYLDLPRFLDNDQPLTEERDAEAYVSRIEAVPDVLAGELERIQSARTMGVVPPDFLLEKADNQMVATLESAMAGELFAGAFRTRLAEAGLPLDYARRAEEAVTGPVAIALERQLSELRTQKRLADSDPGLWSQPRGDEWYAWALRASTTTSLTPDEIHQQGMEELEALHARMDPILRDIGYTSGSVGERMQALSQDPRYKFAEGDPGRAEIMAFIQDRVDWITAQMPRAFNTLVDPNLEIRRLPLAEEPGAPGAYGGAGSKDGTIPGRMWINLRTTDLHRKYDLADLTYHETIPGHVWEGEYSNRLPLIRSILAFNAFSEGWALYGEQIADELGAYDDFAVGRLGYLQSLAFRACRMVVDTGLHQLRWSRAQAVDFFVTRNGSKREEVESEVDRYCSWPGQATGYKVGHSEIVRQRARAERELGTAYDFKAFNDAVVLGGNAPLDVMANNVSRYIDSAGGWLAARVWG